MCLVLFIVVSLSESCNSAQKNKINQDRQSRALQRNSENCDIGLPYSSYQSLESLCNLCASYIRDYPELYGQCRSDCYRNKVFFDICATQLLHYSDEDLLVLTNLLPPKNDNPVFF